MQLSYTKLLALVYADIFDYPLREEELGLFAIANFHELVTNLHKLPVAIRKKNGYFFLRGREKIINLRKKREEISAHKLTRARKVARTLSRIRSIEGVFLTGSVAIGNATDNSDIDLMIVTKPQTMWLTRLVVVLYLKLTGSYRSKSKISDQVCTNIFLDTNNLEVPDKNLYSAHEVLQAKCLYDRGGVERRWIDSNRWIANCLPNTYKYSVSSIQYSVLSNKKWSKIVSLWLLPFELVAFGLQYLYMQSRITSEKIGLGYAYFHPHDLSVTVEKAFKRKLGHWLN